MGDTSTMRDFADGGIHVARQGAIATLELRNPRRKNAMSQAMWTALPEAVEMIESDAQARVVIVRGAGGAFSAGADISEFSRVYASAESTKAYNRVVREGQARLRAMARPTIALVDGICVGGGCGIALACDLRFASTDARFAITPARLGLAYSFADTLQLVEKVGAARAKDMLFSGRMIGGAEAGRFGLVDRLYACAEIEKKTLEYARGLAELSQSSIRLMKAMINAIADNAGSGEAFDAAFSSAFEGEDFREGYAAFNEKRKPIFR